MVVFERDPPAVPMTLPEHSNLNSGLDPEISSYFCGPQLGDPLVYPETNDKVEDYRQHTYVDEPGLPWMLQYSPPLETYIAQPLSQVMLNPLLQASDSEQPPSMNILPARQTVLDDRSVTISPAMLDKSTARSLKDKVIWYSKGREVQVNGKKPLRTKGGGDGKAKQNILAKKLAGTTGKAQNPRPCALGMRYEVNVQTGLDTIKRIKLVFHGDPPEASQVQSPGLTIAENLKKEAFRHEDMGVTQPVTFSPSPAIRYYPLDEEKSSPEMSTALMKRGCVVEVVIPKKEIDKSLYPMFLGKDAWQIMIRSKRAGEQKV
jgi:hypothetical protein